MNRKQKKLLAKDNKRYSVKLQEIPREQWPDSSPVSLLRVLRSCDFLVQIYIAPEPALIRLSVNRTSIHGDSWTDKISWDDLQRIKAEAGYSDRDAVEIFPVQNDVVNVANMRHLWILRDKLSYAWRNSQDSIISKAQKLLEKEQNEKA